MRGRTSVGFTGRTTGWWCRDVNLSHEGQVGRTVRRGSSLGFRSNWRFQVAKHEFPVVQRERHLLDRRKDLVVRAAPTLNQASRVALLTADSNGLSARRGEPIRCKRVDNVSRMNTKVCGQGGACELNAAFICAFATSF